MAHEAFGRRVREAREAKHLTTEQLARRVWPEVSDRQVRRWESGEQEPVGSTRWDLSIALGKRFWELWPPQETADRITNRDTRRVLLEAAHVLRGGIHLYARAITARDLAGCRALARLWLAEDLGVDPTVRLHLFRLTGPGEEVRDCLLAEVEAIHQANAGECPA